MKRSTHISLHEKINLCALCDFQTTNASKLTIHIQSIHKKTKQFISPEFDYKATRETNFDYKAEQFSHITRHVKSNHEKMKKFTFPRM